MGKMLIGILIVMEVQFSLENILEKNILLFYGQTITFSPWVLIYYVANLNVVMLLLIKDFFKN